MRCARCRDKHQREKNRLYQRTYRERHREKYLAYKRIWAYTKRHRSDDDMNLIDKMDELVEATHPEVLHITRDAWDRIKREDHKRCQMGEQSRVKQNFVTGQYSYRGIRVVLEGVGLIGQERTK